MKKRILSLILALSMVLSVLPLGAFAEGSNQKLVIDEYGYPVGSKGGSKYCSGNDNGNVWEYYDSSRILCLNDGGTFDLSTTEPVECKISSAATITGGTFNGAVENIVGTISGGIFNGTVTNASTGKISGGTFAGSVTNDGTIENGTFNGSVTNSGNINKGTFNGTVANGGTITGGVFNLNAKPIGVTGGHNITWDAASSKANIVAVNDVAANWKPYAYAGTTVTITADTEIFSLNGQPIGTGNCKSSYGSDKTVVKFTMPGENVVLNGAITHGGSLVMEGGYPEASNGGTTPCKGNGWTYSKKDTSNPKGKLTLTDGTYDFSYTYPQNSNGAGAEPVACAVETQLRVKITGGTFEGEVINNDLGVISGGTFHEKVSNYNGMITGGTFKSSVTSKGHGRIFGGVFNGNATLTNVTGLHSITVASGAKIKEVNGMSADWDPYVVVTENATTNEVIITADTEIFSLNGQPIGANNCNSSYGSDKKTVTFTMPDGPVVLSSGELVIGSDGYPVGSNGGKDFCSGNDWEYSNYNGTLHLSAGKFDLSTTEPVKCAIQSYATITGGTFNGAVKIIAATITKGIFNGTVYNSDGTISGGTFAGSVTNWGAITGGTFAGSVENKCDIYGGVFNCNATLTDVPDGYSITWDKAYPNAKITEVNGVSAVWEPYVVVTELTKNQKVIITASTEIFSLNGQPIGAGNCNSSYGVDKKTVTFTMPDDDVVLNEEINYGDLVMKNGYPKDSDGGKNPCKGDGWQYIPNDPTNGNMLLLTGSNQTGGLFDFSTIGDGSAVECNVFVGKPTAITGGEFNGKVINNSHILGGTFHGEVDNTTMGTIKDGTFEGTVENNTNGTISGGTFRGKVDNSGNITGGIFAAGLSEKHGNVTGGVFNGKTGLDGVTDLHSITVASNAKIEKVNGVPADWAPYVVTSNATTKEVTITADTEIFSLNGQPIAESSYGVDKKTVTFTMPDDDVVLNGELITKPEPTTYTVTVIGGTIDGKTSVSAKENDTLTVVLDQSEIPDGMTFDMWSISSSKLSGDINVDYRAEAMTFQMPAEDVTIRAQYRSAEIIEDASPSPLATAATIAVGGAAAGIVVWQGVNLGVDLYLANALPQGVPVPTDRRALALLLWETAGKPEVALPTLYGDIPAEEIELQKATRWAVQNGLMDAADKKDASFFDPDHYVTKMDVFGAWLRLKKLLGTIGTSPTQ